VLTPATLAAPDSLVVGSVLLVRWNGPDNPNDFVTLVEAEIPDATYGETRPTRSGRALEFLSPDRPGRWELRYVAGRAKKVLGRTVVTLRPLSAEIAAPGQAVMGTRLAVNWKGPNRPGDFLTIINRKTSDGVIGTTSLVDRGSPLELTVPVEPGEAEIRYMTKDGKVIGRHSLMITIPVTTLFAPDEVVAGATFEVRWHGPDNPSDAVALVPLGASGQAPRSTSTTLGSPLKLTAPSESGPAELRYLAGPKALVLSRRPIRVLPDR
jgi:Ca-activated chloride channel family protein